MTVVTDYSAVTPEWIAGTAEGLLAEAAADVERIEALTDHELTFASTVGAIDAVMDIVSRADGGLSFLGHVHPDDIDYATRVDRFDFAMEVQRVTGALRLDPIRPG